MSFLTVCKSHWFQKQNLPSLYGSDANAISHKWKLILKMPVVLFKCSNRKWQMFNKVNVAQKDYEKHDAWMLEHIIPCIREVPSSPFWDCGRSRSVLSVWVDPYPRSDFRPTRVPVLKCKTCMFWWGYYLELGQFFIVWPCKRFVRNFKSKEKQ